MQPQNEVLAEIQATLRLILHRLDTLPTLDHETRIRKLEQRVWYAAGAAAGAGAGITQLLANR